MGNNTDYTSPAALAKSLIINDLFDAGVTDITGDAAYNWRQSLRKARPLAVTSKHVSSPPSRMLEKPIQPKEVESFPVPEGIALPPKPKAAVVDMPNKQAEPIVIKEVSTHPECMCIVAGAGVTAEEKTLLTNIFKAINHDVSMFGLAFVYVPEVVDEAESLKMLETFLTTQNAKNIILFGAEIGRIIWACSTKPMQEMRVQKHAIFAQKNAIITYHPAALLRQPLLKKLVWHDVQNFKKNYKQK